MKALLRVLICLLWLSSMTQSDVRSQTLKGRWLLEGTAGNLRWTRNDLGLYNASQKDGSNLSYLFGSNFGYFMGQRIAFGTSMQLSGSRLHYTIYDNGEPVFESRQHIITPGFGPFLRYYFGNESKNRIYAEITTSMLYSKTSITATNPPKPFVQAQTTVWQNRTLGISGGLGAGYNHFFTERLAFRTALRYEFSQFSYRLEKSISKSPAITVSYLTWLAGLTILL